MRTTHTSAFRPTLLTLEDRTVPATLVEVTHLPLPVSPPHTVGVIASQIESPAPTVSPLSPVVRPPSGRF